MATLTQLREQQQALVDLNSLAFADLDELFQQVNDAVTAREALGDILPLLVATYGTAAGTIAADWYDELRDEAGAGKRFTAIPAELPDRDRLDALARWGVSPMFAAEPDVTKALSMTAGGLQRIVANAHRDTISGSVAQDPVITGYRRHARSGACVFCAMLATRTVTYNSKASAEKVIGRGTELTVSNQSRGRRAEGVKSRGKRALGEKYHDYCKCVAEPVWSNEPEPAYVGEWRDAYDTAFKRTIEKHAGESNYTPHVLSEMRQILGTH